MKSRITLRVFYYSALKHDPFPDKRFAIITSHGLSVGWMMAKCDEGYLCEVCGQEVSVVTDSDLYLRYILGEVPLEQLHLNPERHLPCNPALAQYIVDVRFSPVVCEGFFDKRCLDQEYVQAEELRVTQGFQRLQAIPRLGLAIPEYPLSVTPFMDQDLA
jgi:hypothetical protein